LSPVLLYESIAFTRRWQGYAARSLFVGMLLGSLLVMWNKAQPPVAFPIRAMAQIGESFYIGVAGTQLALVMLAAPAATAGAICLDRARGTLTHMLMTDLSSAEIVLGKLGARMIPVLCLLACTLPMMELLTLIGGVDPAALWGGFVVSLALAVLGCSLAMFFSLWVGKTHEALLGTYAVWLLWLLVRPMIGTISSITGWGWLEPPHSLDPFMLVLAPSFSARGVDWTDYFWFLAIACSISAIVIVVAIMRIRAVCTRVNVRKPSRLARRIRERNVWRILSSTVPWLTPSLDRNPVLWREWNRSRPSRWAAVIGAIYVVLSLVFSIVGVGSPGDRAPVFINGFQVAIGFLLLSVSAATPLAEERVRGSLDLLMSTALSTREIVLGKWLGVFRTVPLLAILPTSMIGVLAYETDSGPWWAVGMCVYVLCMGAAITSLGLALATRLSRQGWAVGATVSVYVLVTVGWFFLMVGMFGGGGERPAILSPFMWAAAIAFQVSVNTDPDFAAWATIATVIAAWFAAEALASTLMSFDRRLGRIGDGTTRLLRQSPKMRILSGIYLGLAVLLCAMNRDRDLLSLFAAFQFTLGTFLAVANAASSRERRGVEPGSVRHKSNGIPAARMIVLGWLSALRLLSPAVVLSCIMCLLFNTRGNSGAFLWRGMPVLIGYMLAVGAAAVSLGVALRVRSPRLRSPVLCAIVAWAIVNAGFLAFSSIVPGDPLRRGLALGSPFYGVWTLAEAITVRNLHPFQPVGLAIGWTIAFAIAAAHLMRGAIAGCKRAGSLPEPVEIDYEVPA
jgi:ABC-type transport system involved in multi-copper enzyme maturation permease subunit